MTLLFSNIKFEDVLLKISKMVSKELLAINIWPVNFHISLISASSQFVPALEYYLSCQTMSDDTWLWQIAYRMRLNRLRSVYSLFPFSGPDFELSNCKNAYKNSTNINETSYTCFSCANASKNNIKAWIWQLRVSISMIHFWEVGLFKRSVYSRAYGMALIDL